MFFFNKQNKCEPCVLCPRLHDTSKVSDSEGNEYSVRNYVNCKDLYCCDYTETLVLFSLQTKTFLICLPEQNQIRSLRINMAR